MARGGGRLPVGKVTSTPPTGGSVGSIPPWGGGAGGAGGVVAPAGLRLDGPEAPQSIDPDLIRARYAPAGECNPDEVNGDTWFQLRITRPTIVRTFSDLGELHNDTNAPIEYGGCALWFAPGRRTGNLPEDSATLSASSDWRGAMRSRGRGIAYLSNPGVWNLYYAIGATSRVKYQVLDANDPNVGARYLSEHGSHRVRLTTTSITTGTAVQIAPRNIYRHAIMFVVPFDTTLKPYTTTSGVGDGMRSVGGWELQLTADVSVSAPWFAYNHSIATGIAAVLEWV